MCLNRECAVSQLIPFRSCSQHVSVATCLSCLENATLGSCLAQCPRCELWFCAADMIWCLGRPKDLSNRSLDTISHGIPNSDFFGQRTNRRVDRVPVSEVLALPGREHPANPIRCFLCAEDQGPPHCANGACWSISLGINTSICDSCLPGGLWCACKQYWICGTCRTSPPDNYFKDCPRCGRTYCRDVCNYIGFCANCGRTTLCNDCFEEDFAGPNEGDKVILTGRCDEFDCQKRICRECLEGARCVGCGRTVCISCTPKTNDDRKDGLRCFFCTPGIPSVFPADSVLLSINF